MPRCALLPKLRTTMAIDERVMRAVHAKAARTGRRKSEVIEEALRRYVGFDLLERMRERADLDEDEAMKLALEAQRSARTPSR
jgi:Ribbon-helix-helix protein, copG family